MQSTASERTGTGRNDRMGYPTNHVAAIIDGGAEATRTVRALMAGGFLDSEIHALSGDAAADEMHAGTGRSGLADLAIRIAGRLGIADDEMEVKALYERALRDGHVVFFVAAPTDGRRARAALLLHEHGAHSVNFMGRFAITELSSPRDEARAA